MLKPQFIAAPLSGVLSVIFVCSGTDVCMCVERRVCPSRGCGGVLMSMFVCNQKAKRKCLFIPSILQD